MFFTFNNYSSFCSLYQCFTYISRCEVIKKRKKGYSYYIWLITMGKYLLTLIDLRTMINPATAG